MEMKRIFFQLAVCAALIFASNPAHSDSTSASIDEGCRQHRGRFLVPAGQTATNFSVVLNSSWLPCEGAGTPQRIGARILGPAGNTIYYVIRYPNNKVETLAGNLAALALGPGTYTFEVPDGGKRTTASVSFTLKKGPPPPATAGSAVPAAWGTISGDWSDPTVGSKAKIVQSGNSMRITNSFTWQGKQVTWAGSGTVNGNAVTFSFDYTKNRPPMWEGGTMTLTRTAQKKLEGKWTTNSGKFSQAILFLQKKSDDPKKPAAASASSGTTKKPAKKAPPPMPASAAQKNPCPPGFVHRGGSECIPSKLKSNVR